MGPSASTSAQTHLFCLNPLGKFLAFSWLSRAISNKKRNPLGENMWTGENNFQAHFLSEDSNRNFRVPLPGILTSEETDFLIMLPWNFEYPGIHACDEIIKYDLRFLLPLNCYILLDRMMCIKIYFNLIYLAFRVLIKPTIVYCPIEVKFRLIPIHFKNLFVSCNWMAWYLYQ